MSISSATSSLQTAQLKPQAKSGGSSSALQSSQTQQTQQSQHPQKSQNSQQPSATNHSHTGVTKANQNAAQAGGNGKPQAPVSTSTKTVQAGRRLDVHA
jgi:hypothetical protein